MPTKTVKYYHVPKFRKIVATTQRAASASMVESLKPHDGGDSKKIEPGEVLDLKKRGVHVLMWIRDPFDRIACAYNVFGKRFDTVEGFAEHICSNMNPHWSPQVKLHCYYGEFLPTRVYPFESLPSTWNVELPHHPLIHIGENPNRLTWPELRDQMSSLIIADILAYWEDDVLMHSFARQYGCWMPGVEKVA